MESDPENPEASNQLKGATAGLLAYPHAIRLPAVIINTTVAF